MITWIRRAIAAALFALAGYWMMGWFLEQSELIALGRRWTEWRVAQRRHEASYGYDQGRPTGIRIAPLAPAEATAALEYERLVARDLTVAE